MSLDLITTTTKELLEQLKAAYYEQTGETIKIGSDEFASAAVQSYVWSLIFNTINDASNNRFIDYASGAYLDALAANFGITTRPDGYHATANFNVISQSQTTITIPAESLLITDGGDNKFTNHYNIELSTGAQIVVLESVEPGTEYNGIPENTITTIEEGGLYISSATNTTQTAGGTDGFPYTSDGDSLYREYLKGYIQSLAGAGTYKAYESRAKLSDSRVIDVYVLRQNDDGYQKGKVKIFIQTDDTTDIDGQVKAIVQNSCSDESFRPIGDLVVVDYARPIPFDMDTQIQISYPSAFSGVALARTNNIIKKYKDYLKEKINRPFVFAEFCDLMTTRDNDGVYANDAKPINLSAVEYTTPIYPNIGCVHDLQGVSFVITFDDKGVV